MRRSAQSGCLATSGQEDRKWSGLGGVETKGGRRLEMEDERVGVGERGREPQGLKPRLRVQGCFAFTF